jgi:predicted AAA+ superfamily ATPase
VVDLLDESRYQALVANPGLLALKLRALPARQTVVLDEVQRVPALLNEVHRSIESARRRFVLLGSSARRFKTAATNLLAGRATLRTLYPLVPAELGKDFDLERVLRFGSIPLVWQADDPRATLEAYVQLYVREEIRAEALVRNLPGFLRFLPIAALFHGQVVNVTGLARDAATARTTVEGYLGILQDTLLATRLPAFEPRLRRGRYGLVRGFLRGGGRVVLLCLVARERDHLARGPEFTRGVRHQERLQDAALPHRGAVGRVSRRGRHRLFRGYRTS